MFDGSIVAHCPKCSTPRTQSEFDMGSLCHGCYYNFERDTTNEDRRIKPRDLDLKSKVTVEAPKPRDGGLLGFA